MNEVFYGNDNVCGRLRNFRRGVSECRNFRGQGIREELNISLQDSCCRFEGEWRDAVVVARVAGVAAEKLLTAEGAENCRRVRRELLESLQRTSGHRGVALRSRHAFFKRHRDVPPNLNCEHNRSCQQQSSNGDVSNRGHYHW